MWSAGRIEFLRVERAGDRPVSIARKVINPHDAGRPNVGPPTWSSSPASAGEHAGESLPRLSFYLTRRPCRLM